MLHIIWTIIKIAGIVLLVILGLVLLVVFSLLFVPVCYSGWGKKEGKELKGKASVSWLFHLIHGRVEYEEGKGRFEIYLLGIPLMKLMNKIGQRKKTKVPKAKAAAEPETGKNPKPKSETAKPAEQKIETGEPETEKPAEQEIETGEPETEKPAEQEIKTEELNTEKMQEPKKEPEARRTISWYGRIKEFFQKILQFPSRLLARIRKIRLTFQGICDKIKQWRIFLSLDTTKNAVHFLMRKGKGLLRHILPRKLQGRILFGFEDPSWTGQVLGVAAVFYPVYKERFQLTPVFDGAVLEGEIKLSGRIYGIYLLWTVWQVYRNQDVRKTWKRFQHKEA